MTLETVTIDVEANTDKATRSLKALSAVADDFGKQVTTALTDAVVKGEDLDDVFRSLALSIADTALQAGLKPLQETLSVGLNSVVSGLGGGQQGGSGLLQSIGSILPFKRGGIVGSPTLFPLNARLGVAGEAGPEAIIPLKRGADGRLGIGAEGGGGSSNVTVNITTPDAQSFRQSEAQVTAAIARAVQRSRRTL